MTAQDPFKLTPVATKFQPARAMPWAARTFGVSILRQFGQMARLSLPPYLLSSEDYLRYALFRPSLTWAEKTAFVSGYSGSRMNRRLSPPASGHYSVLAQKHLGSWLLEGAGLPVPPIRAIWLPHGAVPGARWLDGVAGIAAYLSDPANFPCFGKPLRSTFAIGGAMIQSVDGGMLHLSDGNRISPQDFAAAVCRNFPGGYLFQPVLQMHPAMLPLCGSAVASLRVVTLWEAGGPVPLYAAVKLPAKDAMMDGPSPGKVNSVAAVDLVTGQLTRAVMNDHMNQRSTDLAPATGSSVVGRALPDFTAALDLACTAHRIFPGHGIFGTDVVLQPDGPLITEMNSNPSHGLYQRGADRGLLNPDFLPRLEEAVRLVKQRTTRR